MNGQVSSRVSSAESALAGNGRSGALTCGVVGPEGLEPSTYGLKVRSSAD